MLRTSVNMLDYVIKTFCMADVRNSLVGGQIYYFKLVPRLATETNLKKNPEINERKQHMFMLIRARNKTVIKQKSIVVFVE